jgi:hypothetical protein
MRCEGGGDVEIPDGLQMRSCGGSKHHRSCTGSTHTPSSPFIPALATHEPLIAPWSWRGLLDTSSPGAFNGRAACLPQELWQLTCQQQCSRRAPQRLPAVFPYFCADPLMLPAWCAPLLSIPCVHAGVVHSQHLPAGTAGRTAALDTSWQGQQPSMCSGRAVEFTQVAANFVEQQRQEGQPRLHAAPAAELCVFGCYGSPIMGV